MTTAYREGDEVAWQWGDGRGTGKVEIVHKSKITKTINGSKITRKADEQCPAYTIKQDDGDRVLKSHSEVSKA